MVFKIFPNPSENVYTPFARSKQEEAYSRLYLTDSYVNHVSIVKQHSAGDIAVVGVEKEQLLGPRIPDREAVLEYLNKISKGDMPLARYVHEHCVIPVYSLSMAEAYVRVIIRQLIRAKQAQRIFSEFTIKFGIMENGIYGFPTLNQLSQISTDELLEIGLGFKAERVYLGIKLLNQGKSVSCLQGIGPWSSGILEVEQRKSYAFYPFWDKSGKRIKEVCHIDLLEIAQKEKVLAGDLYIYAASFLESKRS